MENDDNLQNNSRRLSLPNVFLQENILSLLSGARATSQIMTEEELQLRQSLFTKQSEAQAGLLAPFQPPCSSPSRSSPNCSAPPEPTRHVASAPAAEDSDGAGHLSYRQQTSELIARLDKLLDFRHRKPPPRRRKPGADRRPSDAAAPLKPRPRNVVLKVAAELIRRMQLDDQARPFPPQLRE